MTFFQKIFVGPINANNTHWYFATIDLRDKQTRVYDSLGGSHPQTHAVLAQFMRSEHEDKKKSRLPEDFKSADAGDVPQQHNSYDCGVFMLLGMDFLARGLTLNFSQSDMTRVRQVIADTTIQDGKANNTRGMDAQVVAGEVDQTT